MTQYHNPYHFVPAVAETRPDDLSVIDFESLQVGHVRHDRHSENTFSGRIICRLTNETPIFIGANRTKEATDQAPAEVAPFKLGKDKKAAIPASSLRGLISSVAEAATNSALRVLENRSFSFRRAMTESLSAIGMIVIKDGTYHLRPLTLPNIELQGRVAQLSGGFARLFPVPNLKVYVGSASFIRSADFPYKTFSLDAPKYYGLQLRQRSWGANNTIPSDPNQYIKNGRFLLAQRPLVNSDPIPWEEIPDDEKSQYARGIMRVLGCDPKRDLPNTKKHEIFIPYPVAAESWPTIPIEKTAVERFHELADERTDESLKSPELLPYEPRGAKRNPEASKKLFRLKEGDLVFFRPKDNGTIVSEIAFSSIWRGRVEAQWESGIDAVRSADFFSKIEHDLPPFDSGREQITIAEQLLGFVQDDKDQQQISSLALAGRVYFSHAQTDAGQECFLPPITLRILDSPKPPSPSLYFKYGQGRNGYIAKRKLSLDNHVPQGRKFYLHHRAQEIKQEAWRTRNNERNKQKVKVTPIKSQTTFYFHVDFDNLNDRELGLLLYALKPTPEFRHKLGMGKPIGLGAVNIEPVGLFRINRQARYSAQGLFAPRYSEIWIADAEDRGRWPADYDLERNAIGQSLDVNQLHSKFRNSMNSDIRQALEIIGDPSRIRHRVVVPLVSKNGREADSERETFQWFVANDQGSGQGSNRIRAEEKYLEPLTKDAKDLPTLPGHPWAG